MKYYPIILGTKRPSAELPKKASGIKANPQDLGVRIFERDSYICRCCGFQSSKYQKILHIDGNEENFDDQNVITTCVFCHQCFDLQSVNTMNSGVLIWLPEIGQAVLHHIMRAIYIGRIAQGPVSDASRRALEVLMERRNQSRKRLGSDDPGVVASVLSDFVERKRYEEREKMFKGLRLLPLDRRMVKEGDIDFNQFPQILAYWRSKSGPFQQVKPSTWVSAWQEAMK